MLGDNGANILWVFLRLSR